MPCRRSIIPGSRMQLWTFLADRTYQRDIKPVPTLSCGGVFRYRSGERLHGMQEVTGSIPVISTRKKHRTEMCGAFLVSAVLNSLSHGLHRDSSLGEGALGIAVIFPAKVQSLRTRQLRPLRAPAPAPPRGEPSRKAHCESNRCNEEASGSALGSPFGRAGKAVSFD